MAIKFNDPANHYALIEEVDMDANTVGFTAYGWVKKTGNTGLTSELFNGYGGGGNPDPFLGWDASQNFYGGIGGATEQFSVNPPNNTWFFWAVTIINGVDGFKARWWSQDGTLGSEVFLDNNFEGLIGNITLMGFPGNGQGVPGKIARTAFVPALLNQLALELELASADPIEPPEVCIPNDVLVDECGDHDIIVDDPGDIESEPGDNPELPEGNTTWVATDNFDSYTPAANLHGNNGGTGWAAGWVGMDGGNWTVETAPGGGQGGNAARCAANVSNTKIRRELTDYVTGGIVQWRMRCNRTDPNGFTSVVLASEPTFSTGYCSVSFGADGQIKIYNGNGDVFVSMGAYLADTWYTITLEFTATQYRAKIDNGAYSAWYDIDNAPMDSVGGIILWCSATNSTTFYVDDIKPPSSDSVASRIISSRRLYVS